MIVQQAYQKAAAMCSKSEKCSFDIRQKLQGWELNEDEIDAVIAELIREKFIDDGRYAAYFARDKFRFNRWGKKKIEYQLRMKQIASAFIYDAFDEIADSDYEETAYELIVDKVRKTKAVNDWDMKSKVSRFMQGRGFESELVLRLFDRVNEDIKKGE
ncbi:RecX family transcriptional regulator [Prolixibacteraceae bacterium JC049]|nr:RecX family transcriptional regulator [Prolixibacteraceae bacterium JC049]